MLKPHAQIRRFDVFAEYNRQRAINEGMRADQAKGYALWLAKVVAARRYGTAKKVKSTDRETESKQRQARGGKWLEHPLHPVLTDVPVGAWLSAIALDLVALFFHVPNLGVASAVAIGIGILAAFGSIATGLMDWQDVGDREIAVGLTHGLLNITGTTLFIISFFQRWANDWSIGVGAAVVAIVG